ncbi:MAG: single-stranded-DNA-specific exonuclease RecJ [Bacteroidia bacterium]|nr:single-stranded-DNA-specific exonuclease RecJ [Bacteroidia bacterium]
MPDVQKRWVLADNPDQSTIEEFSKQLNINTILASLLIKRGITTFDEAKQYFRPQLEDLHDPFLMMDMDKAIERIDQAISNNEKILIYGDYDVDGTTAVSLVYSFLKRQYEFVGYYIPDRHREGYGISTIGIDWAKERNYTLIIALDCGIKAIDKVDYAKEKGIDFIICDHHLPGEDIPKAEAILNPKREDCEYPYNELSGCGIGFKLVQAFSIKHNIDFEYLKKYLDLLVVSIASDIVPITGENRTMAFYGIQLVNESPRPGIKALIDLSNKKGKLDITDLVFIVGPRINAAGRMDDAKNAVKLLITSNFDQAKEACIIINDNNTQRRSVDSDITASALEAIENDSKALNKKSTVLFNPDWHKGVIGIVASRLIEKHYRPTIVLTQSNGHATGSARSVHGFNIYNAIDECKDLLINYGGHMYAAGLTMAVENVEKFKEKFEKVVSKNITDDLLTPVINIDASITLDSITPKFFRILKQFGPFGPSNMNPIFRSDNVEINKENMRVVGKDHLKLSIKQNGSPTFDAIAFGQGSKIEDIKSGNPVNICYNIKENEWNGRITLQLEIKDIQLAS